MMNSRDVTVLSSSPSGGRAIAAALFKAGAIPQIGMDPQALSTAARVLLELNGGFPPAAIEALAERLMIERPTLIIGSPALLARVLGVTIAVAGTPEDDTLHSDALTGEASANPEGQPDAPLFHESSSVVRSSAVTGAPADARWERVEADPACRFVRTGYAYFTDTHSAYPILPDWHRVHCTSHRRAVIALERAAVLCCLFRPELSAQWGLQVLQRWLAAG